MKKLGIVGLLFFFVSCEPETKLNIAIENNSNSDIEVNYNHPDQSAIIHEKDIYLVEKNSFVSVGKIRDNVNPDFFEDCGQIQEELNAMVTSDTTLSLMKSIGLSSNWTYTLLDRSFPNGGECECLFTIENSDIQ